MAVLYIIYFTLIYLVSACKKNVNHQRPTTHHGTFPPPPAAAIRNRSPPALWIFFRSRWPMPKTHRHLRMPSTPGVRGYSGRYRIFPARRQMHAKCIKYNIARTDRAAAASTPVRPATQGHGRMRTNVLFRFAPRWLTKSAHRQYALDNH